MCLPGAVLGVGGASDMSIDTGVVMGVGGQLLGRPPTHAVTSSGVTDQEILPPSTPANHKPRSARDEPITCQLSPSCISDLISKDMWSQDETTAEYCISSYCIIQPGHENIVFPHIIYYTADP